MPLYRLQINSLEPDVFAIVDCQASSEAKAIAWALNEYQVDDDAVSTNFMNDSEAAALNALEQNLSGAMGSPFVDWEDGRVVGLDLGYPLGIFGNRTDDQIEPVRHLTHLRELSLRGNLAIRRAADLDLPGI